MERLNQIGRGLACAALLIMTVVGAADIAASNLFGWSVPAAYEGTELLMAIVVVLALSSLQARRMNIAITLLYDHLSPERRKWISIFGDVLGTLLFGLIAWQSWILAAEAVAVREYAQGAYPLPVYPIKLLFAAGATLLLVQYVVDIYRIAIGAYAPGAGHSEAMAEPVKG